MSLANKTPEQQRAAELWQCWRRGWQHGSCGKALDPRFVDHARRGIAEEYARGYEDGVRDSLIAGARAAERLGYDPCMSILRRQPKGDVPT